MTKIKAYMADHDDIAKDLIDTLQAIGIMLVCFGTAPLLMYFSAY